MGFLDSLLPIAGGVGGFLLGGPAGAAAGYGIGKGVAGGNKAQQQADQLQQQAMNIALQRWKEGERYRSALADKAFNLQPQRENLTALYRDPGNPYDRTAAIQLPRAMRDFTAVKYGGGRASQPISGAGPSVPSRPRGTPFDVLRERALGAGLPGGIGLRVKKPGNPFTGGFF